MEEGRQPRSSWTKGLAAMISSSGNSAPDFSCPPNATGTKSQTKNFMLDFQRFVDIFRCNLHFHPLQHKGHWHMYGNVCTQSGACMSGETSSTDYWWVLGTLVAAQVFDYVPLTIHSGTCAPCVGASWRPTLLLREDCLKNLYMIVYLPFVCSSWLSCKNSLQM